MFKIQTTSLLYLLWHWQRNKAVAMQPQHAEQLARTLHEYQQTGYLCDTVLVAEDGQLWAHSTVLAAGSRLFKASLKPSENPMQYVIVLPGVPLYILKIAAHFCYTGNVVIPPEDFAADRVSTVLTTLLEMGLQIGGADAGGAGGGSSTASGGR